MSVGKTKDGRWFCQYRDPRRAGKAAKEYFGHTEEDRKDAVDRDLEIKHLKNRSRGQVNQGDIGVPTFQQLAQSCINARHIELARSTVEAILRSLTVYALPLIGAKPITKITMAHWSAIEKTLIARGITARTINKQFQYLSGIFKWGVDRGYLKDSPWARRKPLRSKQKFKVELPTLEEFQRIAAAADDHLAWAMEVELNTGVRPGPSELFALRWDDFNYETGALTVRTPKTAAHSPSHTQFVSAEFLEQVQARREKVREEDLRLAKRRGEIRPECPYVISFQGLPVQRLTNAWAAAKKKAGITRRLRLYDIRHFYVTHALAAGANLLDLAHRIGHKDANMIVNVYAHLVTDMQTKKPFDLPKIDFSRADKQGSRHKLYTKNVYQKMTTGQPTQVNNVYSFKKNGRGGRI